jgi:hypothetical protein
MAYYGDQQKIRHISMVLQLMAAGTILPASWRHCGKNLKTREKVITNHTDK